MRMTAWALILVVALTGCAAPAETVVPRTEQSSAPAASVSSKRVFRVAEATFPSNMNNRFAQSVASGLANATLAYYDETEKVRPLLAERIPSLSDGTWTVDADGTMKTTYALMPDLKWQDGRPLTASDFVFAHRVYTDPAVPVRLRSPESYMSEVIARDDRTLEIVWSRKYAYADALTDRNMRPVPRHLLEELYNRDKDAFVTSSFWNSAEYVGAGPYRVTRWDVGVSITFTANPYFVMGAPRIETIELHAISDHNAVVAALLAGTIDYVEPGEYGNFDLPEGLLLKQQWGDGQVLVNSGGTRVMLFQYRDVPNHQKALLDVRVRQAVIHGIDRDALAEVMTSGLGAAVDTGHPKSSAVYPLLQPVISKYPYDLRRAEALLGEAGWRKGQDRLVRDATGRSLDLPLWGNDDDETELLLMVDNLKRAGFDSEVFIVPRARRNDQEYRASFPAATTSSVRGAIIHERTLAADAASAANRWGGTNRGGYTNPEADRLYYAVFEALDLAERLRLLVELDRVITADVGLGIMYTQARPAAARTGLRGIKPEGYNYNNFSHMWNVWEWEWSN